MEQMMKRLGMIPVIMAMVFGFMFTGFSAIPPSVKSDNSAVVELNLLNGLVSGNEGVQTSSAYYLGEMKSQKAVLPLMKLLHTATSEEARIIAALSLAKIGDSRGLFAVRQNGKFDDSPLVRRMCENFDRASNCNGK